MRPIPGLKTRSVELENSAKSPCENIGIMGALEGSLKLVQLVAGERGSVSSLL